MVTQILSSVGVKGYCYEVKINIERRQIPYRDGNFSQMFFYNTAEIILNLTEEYRGKLIKMALEKEIIDRGTLKSLENKNILGLGQISIIDPKEESSTRYFQILLANPKINSPQDFTLQPDPFKPDMSIISRPSTNIEIDLYPFPLVPHFYTYIFYTIKNSFTSSAGIIPLYVGLEVTGEDNLYFFLENLLSRTFLYPQQRSNGYLEFKLMDWEEKISNG